MEKLAAKKWPGAPIEAYRQLGIREGTLIVDTDTSPSPWWPTVSARHREFLKLWLHIKTSSSKDESLPLLVDMDSDPRAPRTSLLPIEIAPNVQTRASLWIPPLRGERASPTHTPREVGIHRLPH